MQTRILLARRLARMETGFLVVIALGALVWAFAFIGAFSVVRGVGSWELSRLWSRDVRAEPDASELVGFAPYPGSRRTEFRTEVFGDERVTEVEYIVDCAVSEAQAYYRDAFERGAWTVSDPAWVKGEWVYTVSAGARHGVVEIEHHEGLTEIEIEITDPIPSPGSRDKG